jgi:hypothetical protein
MHTPLALAAGAGAHGGYRARGRGELFGIDRLDGINHGNVRAHALQGGKHFLELDFGQHLDLRMVQPQPARAQRHLRATLLAGDIQRAFTAALQRVQRLQQQRGFANAGVAANQHHAAFDDAAAQHPVQLFNAGGAAFHIRGFNVGQRGHRGGFGQRGKTVLGGRIAFGYRLDQGVPGIALRAFAQPLGADATAFGAGVYRFVFGHGSNNTV